MYIYNILIIYMYICFSTSERGKNSSYNGLRREGLIILKLDFKSGACLWILILKFHLEVSLLVNVYY